MRASIAVAGALVFALGVALFTVDRWLFVALDPGAFDASSSPPAPDYAEGSAWAALPEMADDADRALPAHPASDQTRAPADVFYVHPTTWVGAEWNAPIDDAAVVAATARGGTLIQASVFNACCAVYAPRYRQANGKAFVKPGPEGDRAVDVAYRDVAVAFRVFLARTGERPFFLAAHSQGTILATRLLREEIAGRPIQRRLVAAYLIGGPVTASDLGPGMALCGSAVETGCVLAWNSRGPAYTGNDLEFAGYPEAWLCVNPLTWRADDRRAPAATHAGAVFLDDADPEVLPAFADARCDAGRLLVAEIGEAPRDAPSRVLDWMTGPQNYHPIEYQLFYLDIRRNAAMRLAAFAAGRGA